MKIDFKLFPLAILSLMLVACQPQNPEQVNEKVNEEVILSQIHNPEIPDFSVNIRDFKDESDTATGWKEAFNKAIDNLKEHGGGKLVVQAGDYLVNGPIHFTSNMELHLEKGATLRFGSNPKDYLPIVATSWEGTFLYNYSPFIYAHKCDNIAITGEGVIDGESSKTWSTWKEKQTKDQLLSREMNHNNVPIEERLFGEGHYLRPHLVQFFDCKNVMVEGVRIEDSPFWCVHLLRCENAIVRGVWYNAHNKNNDGVDPEYSRNVLIEKVHFDNGDDNVAIKAGRDDEGRASEYRSENIIVRNCHFKGLHAIVIGSEMSAGVQNVFVHDCDYAGYLKRGIYLKSNPDRGGFIRNIFVKDVTFGKVEDCFYATSYYHNEGEGHATKISDIYFENIKCQVATGNGIVLQGYPKQKITDIYFKNIEIDSVKNAVSMSDADNIVMSDVVIGKIATAPSYK